MIHDFVLLEHDYNPMMVTSVSAWERADGNELSIGITRETVPGDALQQQRHLYSFRYSYKDGTISPGLVEGWGDIPEQGQMAR